MIARDSSNRAHHARYGILLLVWVVDVVRSCGDHSQILSRIAQETVARPQVNTDILSRIFRVSRKEANILGNPVFGTGGGIDKVEDNGSVPNHAGSAGNVLSLCIVDVFKVELGVLNALRVRIVIIGKAYEVSVRILEVVADDDVPNEQVDFSLETAIASPVNVQF